MNLETRVGIFILVAIGIFLYLSINIRALRLDTDQYFTYRAYFDDTGGVVAKTPVKIAGVDVGWVERIDLLEDGKAELTLRISRSIKLSKNAYPTITQDGLIGQKNLEIDPGDPSTGFLLPGSSLAMPGRTPTSVGELLDQFRDIASTVQDIASSFKTVFASRQGQGQMKSALNAVATASDRIANFAQVMERTLVNNETRINTLIDDFQVTMAEVKNQVPRVADSIQSNADKVGTAFTHVQDASKEVGSTFKGAGEVVDNINKGKGTLGKLINEDETYQDARKALHGFRNYMGRTQGTQIYVDMHAENLVRTGNSKGYFDLRIRPHSDYFYLIQLCADERGSITREVHQYTRRDAQGNELKPSELDIPLRSKVRFAEEVEEVTRKKNAILFGLQFGKRFDRLAFRIGLFENSFGFGADYYVPLNTNKVHWITTFEAFDMTGVNRINDTRPHLKWINRIFFMKNLYTSFGVDDFISKHNANPFIGGGIRFGDDDLKYFLGQMPVGKVAGS